MAGNDLLCFPVHQFVENALKRWSRHTVDSDQNPPKAHRLQLFDERHDLPRQVGNVVHQSDRSGRCVNVRPFTFDDARVADPRPGSISPKAHRHVGRRLDIDDLAAPRGERQRDPACTTSDIDYDIVRFDVRSDDREVWTKRSEWIGLHKRMVGGATSALISRRLRAAQALALREHGINPSSIAVGRTVAIGRHHGIFRLVWVSPAS